MLTSGGTAAIVNGTSSFDLLHTCGFGMRANHEESGCCGPMTNVQRQGKHCGRLLDLDDLACPLQRAVGRLVRKAVFTGNTVCFALLFVGALAAY